MLPANMTSMCARARVCVGACARTRVSVSLSLGMPVFIWHEGQGPMGEPGYDSLSFCGPKSKGICRSARHKLAVDERQCLAALPLLRQDSLKRDARTLSVPSPSQYPMST